MFIFQRLAVRGKTKEFPSLLTLPLEIRNIIYKMVFPVKLPLSDKLRREYRAQLLKRMESGRDLRYDELTNLRIPPLLRVCRQIHDEGLPVFYGLNSFRLHLNQDTPVALSNHLALPLPFSSNMLLETFGPESGLQFVEDLTVVWSHDCPKAKCHLVNLLNLGFVGVGKKHIKMRKPERRIGDDNLHWDDQAQVLQAYLAALPGWITSDQQGAYREPEFHRNPTFKNKSWRFPMRAIEDLVRAMRLFKQRCPRAMGWVETKIVEPIAPHSRPELLGRNWLSASSTYRLEHPRPWLPNPGNFIVPAADVVSEW